MDIRSSHHVALSVVVPTYNERGRLPELLDTLLDVFRRHGIEGEIIVVDDNSPDGTADIAQAYSARAPVSVVRRPRKLGLGTAVMAGFARARGAVLGVIDADLSHPPEVLPRMLAALEDTGADIVIASRYVPGGGTTNWPISRTIMSRLACWLALPVTSVRDATSGFFLIARDAVHDVQIVSGGFKICLELLVRSTPRVVAEVPYVFTDRTEGQSKMNWREASGYLRQVVMLWRFQRRTRPIAPRYLRIPLLDGEALLSKVPEKASRA
jgi:dolichol-phosphate mannosyltransferase